MSRVDDERFARALSDQIRILFRFAVTLTTVDDAEDLVQDALARAWGKRAQFDHTRGTLRSWVLAIMADQARSRWRRVSLTVPAGFDLPDEPLAAVTGTDLDLRRAIHGLPPRQRAAIVLQHYADLAVDEIAQVMQCSTGTVKSTLSDARRNLSLTLGATYARD